MSPPPANPRLYHITHVNNLPAVLSTGALLSDATMIARGGPSVSVGMNQIKQRRLALPVKCHAGLRVGDCVPFYFCPRSIMLFVIQRAAPNTLTYQGGQGQIVHLEADLNAVVGWANTQGRRWAFSLANAGSYYTQFRKLLTDLGDIDWHAVASTNFANGVNSPGGLPVKEGKQAEFLLDGDFPWSLVQRIGVQSQAVAAQAQAAISSAGHQPAISVQPSWYF